MCKNKGIFSCFLYDEDSESYVNVFFYDSLPPVPKFAIFYQKKEKVLTNIIKLDKIGAGHFGIGKFYYFFSLIF